MKIFWILYHSYGWSEQFPPVFQGGEKTREIDMDNRIISYEDFKREVCRRALNEELAEMPNEEVLAYLKKEEKFILDMYESATNEETFRQIYGKRKDFEKELAHFRNGGYLKSEISGTVYGQGMIFE